MSATNGRTGKYWATPGEVACRRDLTWPQKAVMIRLADMDPDAEGVVRASFKWLAEQLGMTRGVAHETVRRLAAKGEIDFIPGSGRRRSGYRLTPSVAFGKAVRNTRPNRTRQEPSSVRERRTHSVRETPPPIKPTREPKSTSARKYTGSARSSTSKNDKHQAMFKALADAFGFPLDSLDDDDRKRLGKTAKRLIAKNAGPQEVSVRKKHYAELFGEGIACTLEAVAKHWHQLAKGKVTKGTEAVGRVRDDVDRFDQVKAFKPHGSNQNFKLHKAAAG